MKQIFCILAVLAAGISVPFSTYGQQEIRPVAIENGLAKINNGNSTIQFVGTHVGDEPKPRLGGFKSFQGTIKVDSEDNSVIAMNLSIEIGSLWTQFDKLTGHLKNADFFDVKKFGTATFESIRFEMDEDDAHFLVGNLTMLGSTQEIRLPIKSTVNEQGVSLMSEFQLDRTAFGMNKMITGVEKMVSLRFSVGHPTVVVAEGDDNPLDMQEEEEEPDNQVMTLKLPNMDCSGCAAIVRKRLSETDGISEVVTDMETRTCEFVFAASVKVDDTLNKFAEDTPQFVDYEVID